MADRFFEQSSGRLLLGIVLFAGPLIAYFPCLHGEFLWDDDSWIRLAEPLLRDLSGLRRIWLVPTSLQHYYPLTGTSFWLDFHLWGDVTLGYHVENVLLHAIAAFFLWRLLEQLKVPGPWLAAALFAFHPMMVESVAWITERKNVLSAPLFLGALLAYNAFDPFSWEQETKDRSPRWCFYLLSLGLFVASILAKITAFAFPGVVLLLVWWKRGNIGVRTLLALVPFFVLAVGLGILGMWMERHNVGASGPDWDFPLVERVLIAGRASWFYVGKLLWPTVLCPIYPRWELHAESLTGWMWPASLMLLLGGLWLARNRTGRGPITALLVYLGTLFPVLGFMNVYGMRFTFVADRWAYYSSMSLIALAAAAAVSARRKLGHPVLGSSLVALVLMTLGTLVWRQSAIYKTGVTFWHAVVDHNPQSWAAQNNLAEALITGGGLDEAIPHCERALELRPNLVDAEINLGKIFSDKGRPESAVQHYETALKMDPASALARYNLGVVLERFGRTAEAIPQYQKLVADHPRHLAARTNLGHALLSVGKTADAIKVYRELLELEPNTAETHYNLGIAYATVGQIADSASEFEKAVKIKPNFEDARANFGALLLQTGRVPEAIDQLKEATRLRPNNAGALSNLGLALSLEEHFTEAKANYERSIKLDESNPNALSNFAWLLATCPDSSVRDGAAAVVLARKANELAGGTNPIMLRTLAAAYAEIGEFSTAVTVAESGIGYAQGAGSENLSQNLRSERDLYRQSRPLHLEAQHE